MTLTAARVELDAALRAAGLPVSSVPQVTAPPAVAILPGSPWIDPRGHCSFDVVAYAGAAAGQDWLTALESLVEHVRDALMAAGLAPGDTAQPVREGGMWAARTPVMIRV